MALKDLLVYVDQTEAAFVRLRLAADLAHRHSSRLTALYVKEFNRANRDPKYRRAGACFRCTELPSELVVSTAPSRRQYALARSNAVAGHLPAH